MFSNSLRTKDVFLGQWKQGPVGHRLDAGWSFFLGLNFLDGYGDKESSLKEDYGVFASCYCHNLCEI